MTKESKRIQKVPEGDYPLFFSAHGYNGETITLGLGGIEVGAGSFLDCDSTRIAAVRSLNAVAELIEIRQPNLQHYRPKKAFDGSDLLVKVNEYERKAQAFLRKYGLTA